MLRKPPGLVSEIYLGGVRYFMKESPSTKGITSVNDLFISLLDFLKQDMSQTNWLGTLHRDDGANFELGEMGEG